MVQPAGAGLRCSNPVNRNTSGTVATLRHRFKHGGERYSTRAFHTACYEKFSDVGRPYNPHTEYDLLQLWDAPTGKEIAPIG